ncbi:MAG: hypothetical protein ACREHV_14420 [Rhizomicrobium sp.]
MTIQYTQNHRTNAMSDLITAMGSTGYLFIVSGAAPANVATADSGTELAALPLSSTAGAASGGVLTFNAITSEGAVNTGTAGHFLIATTSVFADAAAASSTTRVAQGSVGVSGSDLNFAGGVSFTSGETIGVSSFTITATGA